MKKSFAPFFYVVSMFGILMGFYTIERIIYYVWNHHGFAEARTSDILLAFAHGLRFDIYALLFINIIPLILSFITLERIQKKQIEILKFLILIPNAFFIAINQIDVEFSNFAGRRMTLGNLHILTEAQGKISAFFMTYGFLMATHILLMILFIYTAWKLAAYFKNNPVYLKPVIYGCILVLIIPLIALGARGGLQRKPLSITHAIIFDGSYLNQMVLNSSFTVLRGKNSSQLKEKKDFKDFVELKPFLNGFAADQTNWKENFSINKTNIVLIIFESLSQDYIEFTPFLKELAAKGLIFTNNYANSRRSIEGISSILAGIPALMSDSYVTSPYFNNELRGLGTYFKNIGYETSFFHGGLPGTMYFDQFTKKAGFDKYYSSDDHPHPKDSDGFWGIYDEPFLQFALTEIDKMKKPFVSGIFTLTSHHPYKIPEAYKDFPKGKIPILQAIYYTDHSLRKFFETAQNKPWFKNTLFVITADHTSLPYTEEFDNSLGRFRVPMIFYHPTFSDWPKINSHKLTQQVDIMPTLLDMFKIQDSNRNLFGKSIFNDKPSEVTLLNDQTYYLVNNKYAVEMRPGHKTLTFNIEKDLKFKNSIENNLELEKKLKATIQYYNNGLIENSLYLK
ncbi:MAG: sulfatase-like hydrolase/transferase [Bdellovibrionota bacterium]